MVPDELAWPCQDLPFAQTQGIPFTQNTVWGEEKNGGKPCTMWPRPLRKDISLVNVFYNIEIYSNGGALVLAG